MNTTLHDTAHKPLFPRGPGLALNFFLLAVLSLALMVFDAQSERFAVARAWMSWGLQPVLWVAESPQKLWNWGDNFGNRDELVEENRQLKQKQMELQARLLKLDSLEAENERIRALLSSAASLEDRVLIAEILSASQDPYRHQIILNRGERDGVYKGQALLDANGVMGYVIQVNPTTCVALLITDPEHRIPVELNRTGLQTIAFGRGDGQGLSLPFLPGNADVKVGDLLVSSGLGGRFPAGYPVGEVFELRHPSGENFMEALAYPSAKLDQGRQALLVWSDKPVQAPPETTAETAAAPPVAANAKPGQKPALLLPKPATHPHAPPSTPTEVPRAPREGETKPANKTEASAPKMVIASPPKPVTGTLKSNAKPQSPDVTKPGTTALKLDQKTNQKPAQGQTQGQIQNHDAKPAQVNADQNPLTASPPKPRVKPQSAATAPASSGAPPDRPPSTAPQHP